jgi:hypothetical protein
MNYDPLNRLDLRPGGRTLRELFDVWRRDGDMNDTERARFVTAQRDPEFYELVGKVPEGEAPPPAPPPGTPPAGSPLTFDASKLSAQEWAKWRKENGV